MRSLIVSLLAATVVATNSGFRPGCMSNDFALEVQSHCGDDDSIAQCLALEVNLEELIEIEQCYVEGGCQRSDAAQKAQTFAEDCNSFEPVQQVEEVHQVELKVEIRQDAQSTSLQCSTTREKSTKACTTVSKTVSCFATTTLVSGCAPGNICQTNAAGDPICMLKDDKLTTSGLIVTIVFVLGIIIVSIGLIVSKLQEKRSRGAIKIDHDSYGSTKKGGAQADVIAPLIPPQQQGGR